VDQDLTPAKGRTCLCDSFSFNACKLLSNCFIKKLLSDASSDAYIGLILVQYFAWYGPGHTGHAGTPERGCNTGLLPPCPLKGGATGAQVHLHIIIISNFMIYQDQLETNLLRLFAHT